MNAKRLLELVRAWNVIELPYNRTGCRMRWYFGDREVVTVEGSRDDAFESAR